LLGWIDGKNVAIEDRFADYDTAQVSANAVAFTAAKVDVIVAFSGVPARAAREATSSISIVMDTGDPVRQGIVASLARSGNNVAGQSLMRQDMVAKQLQGRSFSAYLGQFAPASARSLCIDIATYKTGPVLPNRHSQRRWQRCDIRMRIVRTTPLLVFYHTILIAARLSHGQTEGRSLVSMLRAVFVEHQIIQTPQSDKLRRLLSFNP
jgi:ABC transporter substrate binding protein